MPDDHIDPEVERILTNAGRLLRMAGHSDDWKDGFRAGTSDAIPVLRTARIQLTEMTQETRRAAAALEEAVIQAQESNAAMERLQDETRKAYMAGYREGRKDAFKEVEP